MMQIDSGEIKIIRELTKDIGDIVADSSTKVKSIDRAFDEFEREGKEVSRKLAVLREAHERNRQRPNPHKG